MLFVVHRAKKAMQMVMKKIIMDVVHKLFPGTYNPYRIPNGFRPHFTPQHPVSLADLEQCHEIIRRKKQEA